MPELADTLDRLGSRGRRTASTAASSRSESPRHVPITLDDLARYEVIEREPLAVSYRGDELRTNPPPSSGGRLLAVGLEALGDAEATPLAMVRAMEAQDAMRRAEAVGGTTHISAVDGRRRRGVALLLARLVGRHRRPRAPASSSTTCWGSPSCSARLARARG